VNVKVYISDVLEHARDARSALRQLPSGMAQIGRDAAAYSRQNHIYKNRTGQAQKNTRSVTEKHGDAIYTLVTINVPYGSYLMEGGRHDRPVSLTALEDGIEKAKTELEYLVDGITEQITK
jgi:hypothetical protein